MQARHHKLVLLWITLWAGQTYAMTEFWLQTSHDCSCYWWNQWESDARRSNLCIDSNLTGLGSNPVDMISCHQQVCTYIYLNNSKVFLGLHLRGTLFCLRIRSVSNTYWSCKVVWACVRQLIFVLSHKIIRGKSALNAISICWSAQSIVHGDVLSEKINFSAHGSSNSANFDPDYLDPYY